MNIAENIKKIKDEIPDEVQLVAVTKTKTIDEIMQAYDAGQRLFGENKIQELTKKYDKLPKDIEWHMVGHVQTNKVKHIAPFVSLIHAVDRMKLLKEINKRAKKERRIINCLLQLKIAQEESKFGMDVETANNILTSEEYAKMENVRIVGLMGMATFTESKKQIRAEFEFLKKNYDSFRKTHHDLKVLSMGMSGDYLIAIECGTTMIRVGSKIFGERK